MSCPFGTILKCRWKRASLKAQSATVRFYYTEAERNGETHGAMNVYHWNSSSWDKEPGSYIREGTGNGQWVQVTGVDEYSPFALGSDTPTAATLGAFTATAVEGAIRLEWETVIEMDLLGFHLYRADSPDGEALRLNASLIPGQALGSLVGASYEFLDETVEPGVTYYYWLEEVDVNDVTTRYGPVSALVPAQTSHRIYLPLVSSKP